MIDYTKMAGSVDIMLMTMGAKLTLTQQPEGTTSSAFGVLIDKPDLNAAGTTTLYKNMEMLLSPKMKNIPKPGDWIVRGSSDDRFVVKSVEAVSPAGKVLLYKLVVAI